MSAPQLITDEQDDAPRPFVRPFAEPTVEPLTDAPPALPSSTHATEEPHAAQAPSDDDAELPAPAARDSIHLFAQSPAQLFLHWGHAADPAAVLREAFGDAAQNYRLTVRLSDLTAATEHHIDASTDHAQWLDAAPAHAYRAEVGFHAEGLPFVTVLTSAVVQTPRAAVSAAADHAPEFHITPEDFSRLLADIGYPAEALARHATGAHHGAPTTLPSAYCHNSSSGRWSVVGGR